MQQSSSYQISNAFACLLVGEPKTGKTNVAMGFPDPWFLDLDLNLASAIRRAPTKKFYYDTVNQLPPVERYPAAEKLIIEAAKDPNVKTLVIDGLGGVAGIVQDYIVGRLKTMGVKLRTDTLDDQIRLSDYQTLATYTLRLLALCRASGKYVIWTAHQKADKDELTGANRYKLHMPGNLSENLGGYFTDVWATTSQAAVSAKGPYTKFSIRTKPTGFHVSLGASFPVEAELDTTDKSPDAIWSLLSPKLGVK